MLTEWNVPQILAARNWRRARHTLPPQRGNRGQRLFYWSGRVFFAQWGMMEEKCSR